uniref:Uncharacterized protein n=1 Tax=Arundo donax TaxID=35708 RepID=A0A0A9FY12_ARUDO
MTARSSRGGGGAIAGERRSPVRTLGGVGCGRRGGTEGGERFKALGELGAGGLLGFGGAGY